MRALGFRKKHGGAGAWFGPQGRVTGGVLVANSSASLRLLNHGLEQMVDPSPTSDHPHRPQRTDALEPHPAINALRAAKVKKPSKWTEGSASKLGRRTRSVVADPRGSRSEHFSGPDMLMLIKTD